MLIYQKGALDNDMINPQYHLIITAILHIVFYHFISRAMSIFLRVKDIISCMINCCEKYKSFVKTLEDKHHLLVQVENSIAVQKREKFSYFIFYDFFLVFFSSFIFKSETLKNFSWIIDFQFSMKNFNLILLKIF